MLRFGYTVATPEVRSTSLKAYYGPIELSLYTLSELGYAGVELMVRSPQEINSAKLEQLLSKYNLSVPVVGTGQLESEDKLSLTDPIIEGRQAAVQRLKEVVDFAGHFGSYVNLGRIRGKIISGIPQAVSKDRMKECLLQVLDYAAKQGVKLIIEPQNKSIINWINTVPEALDFIAELNHPGLGTMVDTYHSNIEEKSVWGAFIRAADLLWYVHISDSNGCSPGMGHLNFPEILDVLTAIKYEGFVTVEVSQVPDSRTAAKRAINYLTAIS
jgi:5-keto-L-gluconate epimerase